MPLLQRHGQRRESVLGCQRLTGARGQQEPHHVIMILLGGHVERGEPILGLDIDTRVVSEEDLDHLELAGQGADVQGRVPLLGRRVDPGAPGEQVLHYEHVTLLAGQVQGVQTVLKGEREFYKPIKNPRQVSVAKLTALQVLMSIPFLRYSKTFSEFPPLAARRKEALSSDWKKRKSDTVFGRKWQLLCHQC